MKAVRRSKRDRRERGVFSLIEVLLASLVLALSATATAYWVETVGNLTRDADEQTVGNGLAQVVSSFLANKAFREPGSDGSTFGAEANEQSPLAFDDIDDFADAKFSPPLDETLQPQSALADWTTTIEVVPVDVDTLVPVDRSNLLMIRVTAEHAGRVIAHSWWLRARSPFE